MRRPSRLIITALMASFLPAMTSIDGAQAATTTSFTYTGSAHSWTVPAGVTSIKVLIRGASGGYTNGGLGESITATISVTPGETLQINVGQSGAPHVGATIAPSTFGGGGAGSKYSSSGGGASDIRIGGFALTDRILVAGGGGYVPGGNAGYLTGSNGTAGDSGATGGYGATQSAGGAGGAGATSCGNQAGSPGSLGLGGAGATASSGGAGGGGGYYGGGGSGCNDSGGGGSSYVDPVRTSAVTYSNVVSRTDGAVDFIYTVALQTSVILSIVDGNKLASKGTMKTIRAIVTSTTGGKITFYVNGKRIPGCTSKAITS